MATTSTNIVPITSLSHPGVEVYATLTEAQLCDNKLASGGLFIAESGKVINVALNAGCEPVSLLTEEKHLQGYANEIVERISNMPLAPFGERGLGKGVPIFVGSRELLTGITGYPLTRSVLCAMRRPPLPSMETVLRDAKRVVIIAGVVDTTNIGAIFRSAAALGMDAVLLTTDSCDPLNRRAVRVSMGNIFLVPWTWLPCTAKELADYAKQADTPLSSFRTVAMALTDKSISLNDPCLKQEERLALVMGTEGDGLPRETIAACDYTVRIPMANGVDSLNVAAASAVAFWELRKS